jgi:hypothetical protein
MVLCTYLLEAGQEKVGLLEEGVVALEQRRAVTALRGDEGIPTT